MADAKTKTTKIDLPKTSNDNDNDNDDIPIEIKPELKIKLIKIFKLALTLFYGQFAANAIYSNLIRGLPHLIENSSGSYPAARVTLGLLMLALTVYAIVIISLRLKFTWLFISISGIVLICLSIAALVIDIIDIVQRKERKSLVGGDLGAEIAELIVENILRIAAVVVTFFMSKFIHTCRDYLKVPTTEPKA